MEAAVHNTNSKWMPDTNLPERKEKTKQVNTKALTQDLLESSE